MIKRDLSELKNSKPFFLFDLIVYFTVAAIILAMFLTVFLTNRNWDHRGVYLLFDNEIAAEYNYADNKLTIKEGFSPHFEVDGDLILFYPDLNTKSEYNAISIDGKKKTVKIVNSTCAGKDCTFQEISENGGFIYCAPHRLKIVPMGLNDPVSG